MAQLIRSNYSSPPRHGARIVKEIFSDEILFDLWQSELSVMRERLLRMRIALAKKLSIPFLELQRGMFSLLPISTEDVLQLREKNAIYMTADGRINVAGLTPNNIRSLRTAAAISVIAMKRKNISPLLLIFILLIIPLFSLPRHWGDRVRIFAIHLVSPLSHLFSSNQSSLKEELLRYQRENALLREKIDGLQQNRPISSGIDLSQALPAQVIFRSPTSWRSTLWVRTPSTTSIAYNSPVIHGSSLVGIVDYVGKNIARVRLLTDPSLSPSVRVFRGEKIRPYYEEQLNVLERGFSQEKDAQQHIQSLRQTLAESKETLALAKGEMNGSPTTQWRRKNHLLVGTGFNYDFADEYGPARNLRTGWPYEEYDKQPISLIKEGDLLLTTGMDGLFPPDLYVGQVTFVAPLDEGDYFYEIAATPTAGNLDALSTVSILPPWNPDPEESILYQKG